MSVSIKDCKLFIIACTDIKGGVSKFVVNYLAGKAPTNWIEKLKKGIINHRK